MSKKTSEMNSSGDLNDNSPYFFFDSSGIFALIESGYFHLFCKLVPGFSITAKILAELTVKENLAKKIINEAVTSGEVRVVESRTAAKSKWEEYRALGLHVGEISILFAARKDHDVIVFDDLVARSVARAEGYILTGLLGLLIKLKETSKISTKEAITILMAINQTNFRISSALYNSVMERFTDE